MFTLAVFVGIYSYLIFGLGLVGWLTKGPILGVTALFLFAVILSTTPWPPPKLGGGIKGGGIFLALIIIQAMVNLVGALGPELGFDALWYHLTIPRIWLLEHKIFFIPGGQFYYSVMPKLIDILYVWGETPAKIIHWGFGLLATGVTYKLAQKFVDRKWAILAAMIFYSNLVVGWQSTTAYVDLARTFFEVLALYLLINKRVYKSAIVLGLAAATKILAIGSLGVLGTLVWLEARDLGKLVKFVLVAILVAAPWYVFAYITTGNPVYPIFSGYRLDWNWDFNILRLADPISPIYVMGLPVVIWMGRKLPAALVIYCLLSFGMWFLTPRTGGGRFLLPYLPVWSVVIMVAISKIRDQMTKTFMVGTAILTAAVSIGYRAAANAKYLPVILGKQFKQDFLDKNLDKGFGSSFFYLSDEQLKSLYNKL